MKNFQPSFKTILFFKKTQAKTLEFRKDGPGGAGAGAAGAGTKTCLDNTLISRRVTHARTQRKHKHETRFPSWRCHKGLTPPTSDDISVALDGAEL